MVRWYVLQVSTGQETGVRDALQGLGIRAAVPVSYTHLTLPTKA